MAKKRKRLPAAARPPVRMVALVWICAGLVAGVLLAYGQVAGHEFVDHDDGPYIEHNPHVARGLSWEGLRWSFTTYHMGNWHPLTWLSHMLDCELFGMDPGPHHLVSVALHASAAVLLFLALLRMTGSLGCSAFVAAMFAFHPLRVESVAWAAERKDVLSGLFFMLTLLAYAAYVERPEFRRYACVFVALACGLMAKPMLVTLPALLLLLDVWPLGRWRLPGSPEDARVTPVGRLLLEKLPLLGLAAISSAVSVVAQRSAGAVGSLELLSTGVRVQNAVESYAAYLLQTAWPAGLAYFYPHPAFYREGRGETTVVLAVLFLVSVTAFAYARRRSRPYVAVGWLWYLGMLLPVIGLLQVGMQARADRYTYLPTIGIYLAVAWSVGGWAAGSALRRKLALAGATFLALACLAVTARQVTYWKDSRSLAEHALKVTRDNFQAYNLLGVALDDEERWPEAEVAYRRATQIKADCSRCQLNLGLNLGRQGRLEKASQFFALALRLNPGQDGSQAHNGLGFIYEQRGDLVRAARHFEQSLELEPDYVEARRNLGLVYERQGRFEQAAEQFRIALRLEPDQARILFKLGAAYSRLGRLEDAARQFERVVQLEPALPEAHYNLGVVLDAMGDRNGAALRFEEALRLRPDYTHARQALESIREGDR